MKRQASKALSILINSKYYWRIAGFFLVISSLVFMMSTEVLVTEKNYNEVLGQNLKGTKIFNPHLDKQWKNFAAQIVNEKTSWIYQVDLELNDLESQSLMTELKNRGAEVIHEKSLINTFLYRPQFFLWSSFGIFFALGLVCYVYRSHKEGPFGANVNKYQPHSDPSKESHTEVLGFEDVAGIDEVKDQIEEIVELFKDSSRIEKMGGKIPKGVLLNGPPGTGKTLLAKVTANECKANFISASGSEFVEMYVGVGARRVRDLFNKAKNMSPCIIFIDEIDAVAGKRGMSSNDEREQTLNQLLVEMDGFGSQTNILVIAATNQIEKLDSAILRPGRFDRQIMVHLPDINGREKILNIYLNKTQIDTTVSVREVAKITAGFSGAELANLVNEAILYAARAKKNSISQKDILWAKDKITMGSERKIQMNQNDRIHTAYHEIGHALVSKVLGVGTVSQISIVPRGKALGVTQLEQEDMLSLSKSQAINQLAMMMGGRVAEKIFFSHLSTGAVNDLQRCYNLSRSMVSAWGMSDMGPLALEDQAYRYISEKTKEMMDEEILTLVNAAEELAHQIILANKKLVISLSNTLLEKENISLEEFASLTTKFKSLPKQPQA